MGADLYNHRYLDNQPMLKRAQTKMHALTHDKNGKWIHGRLSDTDQKVYRELSDMLYGDPLYYFRESYGGDGLLQVMGLSWWRDVIPLQDIEPPEGLSDEEVEQWWDANPNNMSAEACQQFIDLLESCRAIVDAYPEDHWEEGKDWETGEPWRVNVGNWYRNRLEQLLAFLRQGMADGGIYASL